MLSLLFRSSSIERRPRWVKLSSGARPSPTRATLTFFHQAEDDVPDYGIPWRFNAPAPVARNSYYGFADANVLKTRADIANKHLKDLINPLDQLPRFTDPAES